MKRSTLIKNYLLILTSLISLLACSEAETVEEPAIMSYERPLKNKQICGGIAGLVCDEDQKCLIRDDYPDASGVCVGPNRFDRWVDECAAVRCMEVTCPEGFRLHTGPNNCCGTCLPSGGNDTEGNCNVASDCEGLIHIACVGSWSCSNSGQCSYTCDSEELVSE